MLQPASPRRFFISAICCSILILNAAPVSTVHASEIDWPGFMARHDMVWDSMPQSWFEAPFLGNGLMGTMFFKDPDSNEMILQVNHADVQDQLFAQLDSCWYNRKIGILQAN
jgi:hypothetical protein